MPTFASLTDPKSYQILTYGTLLGSNLFQTFLAGPLAYKALPKAQFSTLQQAIFPPFFALQTALPVVLALTWPGERVASLGNGEARSQSGWRGIVQGGNGWDLLLPIAVMFGTNLLNLVVLGPATTKVMKERRHQGEFICAPLLLFHGWVLLLHLGGIANTVHRNARRQEILRRRTQVASNAEAQLVLWQTTRRLRHVERHRSRCDAVLRFRAGREAIDEPPWWHCTYAVYSEHMRMTLLGP